MNSPHFTDFQRTYSGDIGSYFADYAEEYYTITADGRITREAKKDCLSTGCDQKQKAYVMTRKSEQLSFGLNGSEENPILNPCFIIRGWGGPAPARLKIGGQALGPSPDFRQGITYLKEFEVPASSVPCSCF